jgi:hypothetical protein
MQSKLQSFSKFLSLLTIFLFLAGSIMSCGGDGITPTLTATSHNPILTDTPISPAIASAPSGMIKIDGQEAFLFGANYPWYNYGTDFGENAWGYSGVAAKRGDIDADFEKMSEMGIRVVRWFVFVDGRAAPEFSEDGSVIGVDDKVFDDLDTALDIAQNHNIRLILVLLDFHWLAPQTKDDKGVIMGGHSDIIENQDKRESFFQNALMPLMQRYGKNPYILSWEVINEPEWAIDDPSTRPNKDLKLVSLKAMQSFVSDTANFIHQNGGKWVTVGSASRTWWNLWENTGLNICQFHYYDTLTDSPIDFPYEKMSTNLPCIVGEFPTAKTALTSDDYYQTIINNGYAGAFPWSLRAKDDYSDVISNATTIQTWASKLGNYIDIPLPVGWVPPMPLPTKTPMPTPLPTITLDPNLKDDSQYGFEIRQGDWTVQTFEGNKAVTSLEYVYQPDHPVYSGQYALQLNVTLIPKDEELSKGEAYVDVNTHPPLDNSVGPYDLSNSSVTCWVYLPKEAYSINNQPWIGLQVFAKDNFAGEGGPRSEYGDWTRVAPNDVGKWIRITLRPRTFPSPTGWIDKDRGFDPTAITLIGVKIGVDDFYAKEDVSYNGPIYVDACTWK